MADQCALRHQRPANAARNRRRHVGVIQVNARRLQRRLANGHIGLRLFVRSNSAGIFLLADRIRGNEWRVACGQRRRLRQIGL